MAAAWNSNGVRNDISAEIWVGKMIEKKNPLFLMLDNKTESSSAGEQREERGRDRGGDQGGGEGAVLL